jgi:uncharacterized protein with PhoU and TrkA domain
LREVRIIDVVRNGERLGTPLDELRFAAGDQLLLETPVAGVKGIKIWSRSTFVGKTLRENFEDVRLAFGDTLLVQGPAEGIHRLMQERDFLNLTEPKQRPFAGTKRRWRLGRLAP